MSLGEDAVGVDGTGVASRLISPSQLPPTVNLPPQILYPVNYIIIKKRIARSLMKVHMFSSYVSIGMFFNRLTSFTD